MQVPEKNIKLLQGGCPTHVRITLKEVAVARERHPEAKLLVHPECLPKVTQAAKKLYWIRQQLKRHIER